MKKIHMITILFNTIEKKRDKFTFIKTSLDFRGKMNIISH